MKRLIAYTIALLLAASLLLWGASFGPAVAATADDGFFYASLGFLSTTGNTDYAGKSGANSQTSFFRFVTGVSDLSGATITAASMNFYAATDTTGSPTLRVYAVDSSANPASPTTDEEAMGLVYTTAYASYSPACTAGTRYDTPSITSVIQELVDSYGNLTSIIIGVLDASSPNDAYQGFRDYTFAAGDAAVLNVTYTTSGGARRRMILTPTR